MSCEGTIGMITITQVQLVRGRSFTVNQQYCYESVKLRKFGCGCNGSAKTVKFYTVDIEGIKYELDGRKVVESDIPIPIEDQDQSRMREIGDTYLVESFNALINDLPDPYAIAAAANDIPM